MPLLLLTSPPALALVSIPIILEVLLLFKGPGGESRCSLDKLLILSETPGVDVIQVGTSAVRERVIGTLDVCEPPLSPLTDIAVTIGDRLLPNVCVAEWVTGSVREVVGSTLLVLLGKGGGGDGGGDKPGVPESGLRTNGGEVVLLKLEDVSEANNASDNGVFRGDGERVNMSAEDDDRTES